MFRFTAYVHMTDTSSLCTFMHDLSTYAHDPLFTLYHVGLRFPNTIGCYFPFFHYTYTAVPAFECLTAVLGRDTPLPVPLQTTYIAKGFHEAVDVLCRNASPVLMEHTSNFLWYSIFYLCAGCGWRTDSSVLLLQMAVGQAVHRYVGVVEMHCCGINRKADCISE